MNLVFGVRPYAQRTRAPYIWDTAGFPLPLISLPFIIYSSHNSAAAFLGADMNGKEIKAAAHRLIASGMGKSDVFSQLSGQGVKDSKLAHYIASYADPALCDKYEKLNNVAIHVMFIQSLFALFIGYGLGAQIGPNAKWITAALIGAIPLLFAWGFYKYHAGTYNAYILLTMINLPKQLGGFATAPVSTTIGLVIGIAVLALVMYLRMKLFPDFVFTAPRKVKGKFVFSS